MNEPTAPSPPQQQQSQPPLSFPPSLAQSLGPYLPPPHSSASDSQETSLPHLTLTYATSLDASLALSPGTPTLLSGPESKAMTHYLRSRHDAVLIGAGTSIADDPGLNCRLQGVELAQQPTPVVLDPSGRWEWRESRCFKLAKAGEGKMPLFLRSTRTPPSDPEAEGGEPQALVLPLSQNGKMDWHHILALLHRHGIRSVMIEGGGSVIQDLLSHPKNRALITSVILTIAPVWLGRGGVVAVPGREEQGGPVARLTDVRWVPMGEDVVMCGKFS